MVDEGEHIFENKPGKINIDINRFGRCYLSFGNLPGFANMHFYNHPALMKQLKYEKEVEYRRKLRRDEIVENPIKEESVTKRKVDGVDIYLLNAKSQKK